MAIPGYNAGGSVTEVPTVNDWSRRAGVSKMNLKKTVIAYGRLMAAHIVGRIQPPPISPLADDGSRSLTTETATLEAYR